MADPLTGEGLHSAFLSAQFVAASIEKALARGDTTLDGYRDTVAVAIVPNMKMAAIFLKVLSLLPAELFRALNRDERVWRACCNMLRGEMDYLSLKNRVTSLGKLFSFVSHI